MKYVYFFVNYLLRKSNNTYCHFDKSVGGLHWGLIGVFFLQSATDGD